MALKRIHIKLTEEQCRFIQVNYPSMGYSHVIRALIDDHIKKWRKIKAAKFDLDITLEEENDGRDEDTESTG